MCPPVEGSGSGHEKETGVSAGDLTQKEPSLGETPYKPPTKLGVATGGLMGICAGLGSYFLLYDSVIVGVAVSFLYGIGTALMVDYMRLLREAPYDGGSWWASIFGGVAGLGLMIIQGFVPHPLMNITWVLVFDVALVSLVCGIGMAVGDLSEY